MSDSKDLKGGSHEEVFKSTGMTYEALLRIIARVSEITLPDLVTAARVSPHKLVSLLRILQEQKLISIEGKDTFEAFVKTVEALPVHSSDEMARLNRDQAAVYGVPPSVIGERQQLVAAIPEALKNKRVTVSSRGFSRVYSPIS